MELVKGRKPRRTERRDEDMFRYTAHEEIWEVPFSQDCEYEEREAQTIVRKRPDLPIAS
jgi:hypothetical protein